MSSHPASTEPAAPVNGLINRARRRKRTALRLGVGLLAAVSATALVLSAYETVRDTTDRAR